MKLLFLPAMSHSLLLLSEGPLPVWLSEAELPLEMGDQGELCLCPPPLCHLPATVLFPEVPQGQEARSKAMEATGCQLSTVLFQF